MGNKSALLAGILAGLASPGTVKAETKYPRLDGNDMARLRSDVARVATISQQSSIGNLAKQKTTSFGSEINQMRRLLRAAHQ